MTTVLYYSYTPGENKNRVLYGRAKEIAPGSTFEFFVLAREPRQLRRWIRLGKWMAKAEVRHEWYALGSKDARVLQSEPEKPQLVSCPVNPLDIAQKQLSTFDIVVMPPASLLTNPRITGPYCRLTTRDKEPFWDKKNEFRYVPLQMSYFGGEGTV